MIPDVSLTSTDKARRATSSASSSVSGGSSPNARTRIGVAARSGLMQFTPNSNFAPLVGERLSQVHHGCLGCAVGRIKGSPVSVAARCEEHEVPASLGKVGMSGPGDIGGAEEIRLGARPDLLERHRHEWLTVEDRGGVDDRIDRPVLFASGAEPGLDLGAIANVETARASRRTHCRAISPGKARHRLAYAARRSNDREMAVVQPREQQRLRVRVHSPPCIALHELVDDHEVRLESELQVRRVALDDEHFRFRHVFDNHPAIVGRGELRVLERPVVGFPDRLVCKSLRRLAKSKQPPVGYRFDNVGLGVGLDDRVRDPDRNVDRVIMLKGA